MKCKSYSVATYATLKMWYFYATRYKESEPEEWTGIIPDALNNSDIPDQELKVIKDSLVDELLFY